MDLLGSLAIESVFPILYAYQIRRKLTVVSNLLVSMHNNRIALGGVDSNRVYCNRPGLNAIGFNNGHVVAVDREGEVGVARDRDEAEAVALALGDRYDGEVGRIAASKATETVDQDGVRTSPALH